MNTLGKEENLGIVWGRGNNLLIYKTAFNVKNNKVSLPPILNEIGWEMALYNRITRKLANDSSGIFLSLQKLENQSANIKQLRLKISHRYRSVLKATVDNLQAAADGTRESSLKEFYEQQSQAFYKMELVWNLCEILFVDGLASGTIISSLLNWIRWHFTDVDRLAKEVIETDTPDSHPRYWDAVFILVLQGRTDDARKMLRLHSSHDAASFLQMDKLLKTMPIYSSVGSSVSEFELHWNQWQEGCKWKLQEETFAPSPQLVQICQILCGEKQVFVEVADLCETWYHMLISKLFYTKPTIRPLEIQHYTEECLEVYGCNQNPSQLDSIIWAAFEYDPFRVIRESSLCFDTWWFATHLTDLLYHCDRLNSDQVKYSASLREFLLLDYVASLMSHDSLWQVAIVYLDYCQVYGKQHMELYLERIPLHNDLAAMKVLHIAQTRDLPNLAHTVYHVMGMKALHNKNIGAALMWALKSKDSSFATYLADILLREYSESGKFSNLDLLDNLGSSMVVSNELTFLAKYREFHNLYVAKEFKLAATLLTSLLSSRLAPRYFWLTLLLDALPLLESEEVTITCENTYELMYCLEMLQKDEEKNQKTPKVDAASEKVDLVRLALARNLAKSIISEGTVI